MSISLKKINFFVFSILLTSNNIFAAGMVPQSPIVIVEESDGEGTIDIKNTEDFPGLLITKIENIQDDQEELVTVFPPVMRVEANETQTIRFFLTSQSPLKTERLKRVSFEGVPPKNNQLNKQINVNFKHNMPLLIRPKQLAKNMTPWTGLVWKIHQNQLLISNPTPYVVRFISPEVVTKVSKNTFTMPQAYILPNQSIVAVSKTKINTKNIPINEKIIFYPATTWGFALGKSIEAHLTHIESN